MSSPMDGIGIEIKAIWLDTAEFRDLGLDQLLMGQNAPDDLAGLSFHSNIESWVRKDEPDSPEREAILRVTLRATPHGHPSYSVKAAYVAVYSWHQGSPMSLEDYVAGNGIANLIPYLREHLATLTQRSRFSTLFIPPLNVDELVKMADERGGEVEPSPNRDARKRKKLR